jgi:hypothetical protein
LIVSFGKVNLIAVLGGLTDVERDLIRTHISGGRERAKTLDMKAGLQAEAHFAFLSDCDVQDKVTGRSW